MEIYNENMELIENPDLTKGHLEHAFREVTHPAVEGVEEVWHYETAKEYPNGGKDVVRVVDVPGVKAVEAWTEQVEYMKYILYTPEELERIEAAKNKPTDAERIALLEEQLAAAKILLGVE